MEWLLLFLLMAYSVLVNANNFQCLTCDNLLDGPGCGEFTRIIPVRTCQTFCYFAVIHNRSADSSAPRRELSRNPSIRAIRDCSPYADMNIDGTVLLKPKIDSFASVNILTIRRCDSEQCNNDFYLDPTLLLSGSESAYRRISVPLRLFSFVIIFYYSKSMF